MRRWHYNRNYNYCLCTRVNLFSTIKILIENVQFSRQMQRWMRDARKEKVTAKICENELVI